MNGGPMLARPRLHKSILRNLVGIRRLNNKYIHLFETIASSKTLESLSGTETVPKTVSGFGGSLNDPAEALKVSLYEAMERLFGFEDQQTKMVKSTYARLADEAINPTRFFPTKCLQYEHSRHTKYSSQIPLSWVRVYTLDMRVSKLVPASLVILGFSSSHPSEYIFPLTSSGLAAHPDLKESLVHGCLELIESDAFQIVWLNRLSRPLVCPDTITDSNVNKTIDVMEEDGFQISFIDLTSDLGVPVILTKIFNPKINWRSAPVFGLGCSLWPETSLKKSIFLFTMSASSLSIPKDSANLL
jgi:thiazole/oxazole-forming peptide maturase SagD family component